MATKTATFAEKDMQTVRLNMVLDEPFFGALALNLRMVQNPHIPTLCVDGVTMWWNPDFVGSLTPDERKAVVAHEVMHCALLHIYRRGDRDPFLWNIACDYALNLVLVDSGFKLPNGCLIDPSLKGMSAEEIYPRLKSQVQKLLKQCGAGSGQSGTGKGSANAPGGGKSQEPGNNPADNLPTGHFLDGDNGKGDGKDKDGNGKSASGADGMNERDWQLAAEQAAAVAKAAGKLPGNLIELIHKTHEPRVDWRAELMQFVSNTVVSDISWHRSDRRYIAKGMYLPGPVKENVGPIVVGLDTSGSVSTEDLMSGASELTGVLHTARPEKIVIVGCDTEVTGVTEFTPEDGEVKLEAKGRGGTCLRPVFDYVREKGIEPVCMLYFTDLESSDTPDDPGYPVLWVVPEGTRLAGPFGKTIIIPAK